MLIALTLIVLFGMLGLAIDGGRAYIDRRELQNAVDAAVLAAGDNFESSVSLPAAGNEAALYYGLNEHISSYGSYSSALATCPSTFPAGSTCTNYTWSGYPGTFTYGYVANSFGGYIFSGSAVHQVAVTFMQVLGVPSINNYTAIAESLVGAHWQTPALLTLGQNGCNGNQGSSLVIQGSVTVTVKGDVYSDGNLTDKNGAPVTVNGSVYSQCGSMPSGWTATGTIAAGLAPVLADPGYTSPYASTLYNYASPTSPVGNAVELKPGVYANDPQFTGAVCHFLDPGVYSFPAGYTNNGGMISNELRPPIEPFWDSGQSKIDYTKPAGLQFWYLNNVSCAGDFYATAVTSTGNGGKPLKPSGAWGIEITAVREDPWPAAAVVGGGTYLRETAPSMCHALQSPMDGSTKGFQVVIGNVPGATGYYVYANPNGCNSAGGQSDFGFAGYVPNAAYNNMVGNNGSGKCGSQSALPGYPNSPPAPGANNAATSGNTYNSGGCLMGYVSSQIFDNNNNNPTGYLAFNANNNSSWGAAAGQCSTAPFNNPGPSASLPPQGCNPPDGERAPVAAGLPNESPARGLPATGDRADEDQCRAQSGADPNFPCAGAQVTPGAIQFYFPPNACFNQQGNGGAVVYSGYQYNWIVVFAPGNTSPPTPPTPNSCAGNNLSGSSATEFKGTIYLPTGSITINGSAAKAPVAGQVICYNALIDGSSGVAIGFDPNLAPAPPSARLIL